MREHRMNKRMIGFLAAAAITLGVAATASAQERSVAIIVNASNKVAKLTDSELRNLFTGGVTFWPGDVRVKIIMRPATTTAGKGFLAEVLQMTPTRFRQHWTKLQLSGLGVSPTEAGELDDVVTLVAGNPGAISYVHASEVAKVGDNARVRVIRLKDGT
jgi:ABC-type phosphate transport system substrate-binding protein